MPDVILCDYFDNYEPGRAPGFDKTECHEPAVYGVSWWEPSIFGPLDVNCCAECYAMLMAVFEDCGLWNWEDFPISERDTETRTICALTLFCAVICRACRASRSRPRSRP